MRGAYAWLFRYRDQVFAAVLAVGLVTEVWTASYAEHRVASSAAALLATLPFAVRRRYPIPVFVLLLVGTGTLSALSPDFDENSGVFFIAFVFNLYSLGANTPGRQGWLATALVIPCVIWFLFHDGDSFHPGDIAFAAFVIGGPYAAGVAMRLRRQRERHLTQRTVELELERDARARAAVAEERRRIARELHDVVAHAISVIVVQARGGRRRARRRRRAGPQPRFDTIERDRRAGARRDAPAARHAARRDEPSAALAPQPALRRARRARRRSLRAPGLPVEVAVEGEPVELAAGRRPLRLPDRAGGADERAQARRRRRAPASRALRRRRARARGRRRRPPATGDGERRRATGSSACASASRVVGGTLEAGPPARRRLPRPRAAAARGRRDDPRPGRRRPGAGPRRASG